MSKKWLLRFGSSILAFTLLTGCATNNDNEEEPLEEGPMDMQEQDNMDEGGTNGGTDEGGTNGGTDDGETNGGTDDGEINTNEGEIDGGTNGNN